MVDNAIDRLHTLGLRLPPLTAPPANFVATRRVGSLLYVAGQLPLVYGRLTLTGRLGEDLDTAAGVEQARIAALNSLAVAADAAGGVERLQLVQVMVFVACSSDYYEQHLVANGASDLFTAVLGTAGEHVRTAIGVPCLPRNGAVEVQAIFTLP
jgi:enamine deaminase RidA (YjgF/YER057c/UK114 family)